MPVFLPDVPVPPFQPVAPPTKLDTDDAVLKQAKSLLSTELQWATKATQYTADAKHAASQTARQALIKHATEAWIAAAATVTKLIELIALNPTRVDELDPGAVKANARRAQYVMNAQTLTPGSLDPSLPNSGGSASPGGGGAASEGSSTPLFAIGAAIAAAWWWFKGQRGA